MLLQPVGQMKLMLALIRKLYSREKKYVNQSVSKFDLDITELFSLF